MNTVKIICLGLCLAAIAIGDPGEGDHAQELRRLRAENAMLRKQVARLKAELARKNEPASQPAGETTTKPKPLSGAADFEAWLKSIFLALPKGNITQLQADEWAGRLKAKVKARPGKGHKRIRLTFQVSFIQPKTLTFSRGGGGVRNEKIIEVSGETSQDTGKCRVRVWFPATQKSKLLLASRQSTVVVTGKLIRLYPGGRNMQIHIEGEGLQVLAPAPIGKRTVKP